MRTDILESKEQILLWISENRSKAFICKQLKCKTYTLDLWLRKMKIEYNGNRGLKGYKSSPTKKTAFEYANSSCAKSLTLKKKLINEGIKEDKCEKCGLTEWQGMKIPTELHHKDGDHFNNDFDNLSVLCCNCHALTDDYCVRKHFDPKRPPKPRKSNRKPPRSREEMAKIKHRTPEEYHNDVKAAYHNEQQKYIPLVLSSDIDFNKFGWVTKLAPVISQKPQKVNEWMKRFMPDFYKENCFKRFSQ
jgi:hypothetical protein